MNDRTGRVLRIEKTSIHDGDGLRAVVFLKGCPLHCAWCSTPESQCMDIAYGYGKDMTVSEVVEDVSKDEIFFFHSGGGVTISGGEVLMQLEFSKEVLKECCMRGINTAIESSFYSSYEHIEMLLPYLNSIYVDLKHMNSQEHKKYTGVDNRIILENIRKAAASQYPVNIHIRVPMIPKVNMTRKNLELTGQFVNSLAGIADIELLPYHRLGTDTYEVIGKEYLLKDIKPPTKNMLRSAAAIIKRQAPNIKIKFMGDVY